MKTIRVCVIIACIVSMGISAGALKGQTDEGLFSSLAISHHDVPQGFVFGEIPRFAQKVFPKNPCVVNGEGIRFLSDKVYPEGSAGNIKSIYAAIMAEESRPYGDDLVCYVIMFKDNRSADAEIKKIQDFFQYNKDRIVFFHKDTVAVLLFADNINNYKYIAELGEKLRARLD